MGSIVLTLFTSHEIDINLIRDQDTNKSLGFAFVKYEDQRSTILAVDNFNGIKLLGRTLRCDHVEKYKLPKEVRQKEEALLEERPENDVKIGPGHAYSSRELLNEYDISKGLDLWAGSKVDSPKSEKKKHKKHKKVKKHKGDKRKRGRSLSEDIAPVAMTEVSRVEPSERPRSLPGNHSGSYTAGIAASSVLPPPESACSWRGRMDPAVIALEEAQRKKLAAGETARRDEFDGIGGMKRRR